MIACRFVPFLGVALVACLTSSQSEVEYGAEAIASSVDSITAGGWTVRLMRAELAFGPAYFCASASGSSSLCGTAIAELASVTRIDALSAAHVPLGRVHGLTGSVRSATYDLGILWLDTQQQPTPDPSTPNGHSAVLEGEAVKGDVHLPFIVLLDVAPQYQGQHAIATAPALGDVASEDLVLEVHFDPARWLAQVDFDVAAARPERPLVVQAGSPEHTAVIVGLKSLAPPEFRWIPIRR
jgi:hypothetical protein